MSKVDFLPKVLNVSIQIIGNKNKLITGIKSSKIQYFGRLIICINTIPLYMGTKASHAFLPAFTYNFQVPIP